MTAPAATALVSGGKDSIYAAYLAETQGFAVGELVTLRPEEDDAWLFHTPNLPLVALQAEAWGKAHRSVAVAGRGEAAEAAALHAALEGPPRLVTAGAIASSYQWARLHRACFELGHRLYTPLWGKDAGRVVREEIGAGLDIRLVHLAAEPLTPDLLGRRLDLALLGELERRSAEVRAVHVAGEGGEYETLVLDAPFFASRLVPDEVERTERPGTSRLTVRRAHLAPKGQGPAESV